MRDTSLTAKPRLPTETVVTTDDALKNALRQVADYHGRAVVLQTESGTDMPIRYNVGKSRLEIFAGGTWQAVSEAQKATIQPATPVNTLEADGATLVTVPWTASKQVTGLNFVSTIAVGTAPYACTSTTLNTNLNADLVDSLHAQALTATSPITLSAATKVLASAGITIAHAATDGNIHLPSGGTANQILKNSGVAGTGAWGTVTENAGALAAITTLSMSGQLTGGALVVDTTTLVVNAAGYTDKVGIGTATPSRLVTLSLTDNTTTFGSARTSVMRIVNPSVTVGSMTGIQFAHAADADAQVMAGIYSVATSMATQGTSDLAFGLHASISATTLTEYMRIKAGGNIGIGTLAPLRRLDINDASGNCVRLIYNDADGSAANYADFLLSSTGNLTVTPSGLHIASTASLDLATALTLVYGSAGTATWVMPFQGNNYKKFKVYLSAFVSAGGTVITFPTFFTVSSHVYGTAAAVAIATVQLNQVTLTTAAATTGWVIVEGY